MSIDLRDIELLVATVDSGSITEGAQTVGLSLSAASFRITDLEKEHGVNLVQRLRTGVVPTEVAEAVLIQSRKLLEQADQLTSCFPTAPKKHIKW